MALGALLAGAAVLGLGRSFETDVFFRVRVGQEIWARRALLHTNTFSFTYPAFPELDTAWLSEVGMAVAYRWGGWPGVVIGKALLVVSLALALWRAARAVATPAAATVVAVVALGLMHDRLVERPHLVSLVMGAAFSRFMLDERALPPLTWRRAISVVALLVAWANAHAGVFVAPVAAATLALGARFAEPGSSGRARARRWALWAVVAAGACLAQPQGVGLVRYLWLHMTLPRLHTVDEFRAATWRSDAAFLVAVASMAVVAALLARHEPARRPWIAVAAAFTLLALGSVRFSADALVWWVPLAAASLDRVFRRCSVRTTAIVVAAVSLALIARPLEARARAGLPLLRPDVDVPVPADALAFVDGNGLRERMYNDFEAGSYLLWEGYPRARVFVDPRLPAYPASFHALLGRFDHDRASWDAAMTSFGVESALLVDAGLNRRVAWWDPSRWALVFRAHDARVFLRRLPKWRALIAAQEIPLTYDFTVEEGAAPRLLVDQPATSEVPSCEWQRRLGDLAFEMDGDALAHAWPFYQAALTAPGCLTRAQELALLPWLGGALLRARRASDALPLLRRAHDLDPADAAVHTSLALTLEALEQRAEAQQVWNDLSRAQGDSELGHKARARAAALHR